MKTALAYPSGGPRLAVNVPFDPLPAALRRRQRCLPPPAEADPLFNVVGQARPDGLHPDFDQAAQPKLAKAQLVLDPGIRELRHRAALPVDLLRLCRFHLGPEGYDRRGLFQAHHHPSFRRVVRTTFLLEGAGRAIGRPRPVVILGDTRAGLLPLVAQRLARWTLTGVALRSIRKRF